MPTEGRDLIWWAGPHSWESGEPVERMARKVLARYGIGRLVFIVDGSVGFGKHMVQAAHDLSIPVLELKPDYTVWNHRAGVIRNSVLASLPVDRLIAVRYMDSPTMDHPEVQSAVDAAETAGIRCRVITVNPETANPSLKHPKAPGRKKEK